MQVQFMLRHEAPVRPYATVPLLMPLMQATMNILVPVPCLFLIMLPIMLPHNVLSDFSIFGPFIWPFRDRNALDVQTLALRVTFVQVQQGALRVMNLRSYSYSRHDPAVTRQYERLRWQDKTQRWIAAETAREEKVR